MEQIQRQGELQFWRLNLKPGKPLAFGRIDNCWIFGLPVTRCRPSSPHCLLAQLLRLAGVNLEKPLTLSAVLATPIQHSPGHTEFQRGQFHQDETGFKVSYGRTGIEPIQQFSLCQLLDRDRQKQGNLQMGDVVNILPLVNLLH